MINHWQDSIGSDFVIVSAGARADDPNQGMLMVLRVSGNRLQFERKIFNTPHTAGAVRVVGADGTLLTLESASGVRFQFNAASGTFQ